MCFNGNFYSPEHEIVSLISSVVGLHVQGTSLRQPATELKLIFGKDRILLKKGSEERMPISNAREQASVGVSLLRLLKSVACQVTEAARVATGETRIFVLKSDASRVHSLDKISHIYFSFAFLFSPIHSEVH
jgi:hypothetical protein